MAKENKTEAPKEEIKPSTDGAKKYPDPVGEGTPKEEKVEVNKSTLEAVLEKQKDQEKQIEKLKGDNERLIYSADKSRLAYYDSKVAKELIHTFRVGTWVAKKDRKVKLVLGWKMVKDDAVYDSQKQVYRYEQVEQLCLDEGEGKDPSYEEVDMLEVSRRMKRVTAELVKESKTNDGVFKTLRFEDGREIEFDVRFLNR